MAVDFESSPALSAQEEWETFQIKPGYRIELVASEPLVEDPILVTFDEDGRLWVVEMRGFMPDIEGNDEDAPVGRVSLLWDDDNDGLMDRRTTFLDSLVLPRALAIVKGGALVAEKKPLWFAEDLDGDFIAERKTLVDSTYGGIGLPEHSPNGLWRGIDNWYYNAKSRARLKNVDGQWIQEETEFRGQWGISHDDVGRLYYNYNWSQLHADLVPPNYLSRNPHHTSTSGIDHGLTVNRSIYPIRPNRAVNRGAIPGNLDEEGKLLEFTSASAPLVYRGAAIPEFYGDVFVCEPAGNLIKRNTISQDGIILNAAFPYPDSEFLASTDERFRPVSLATGPDGALYVVDMYRGVIQHGAYITPYLKEQSISRNLVDPVHLGRIWRIVPDDWEAPAPVALSAFSMQALVDHLSHEDGWHRDTAQRLLVERQDAAAIPILRKMALEEDYHLGRLHALWTLQGLGDRDAATYLQVLQEDNNPDVQAAALRMLEEIAGAAPEVWAAIEPVLIALQSDAPPPLTLQIALTAGGLPRNARLPLLAKIIDQHVDQPVMRDAVLSGLNNQEFDFLNTLWELPSWEAQQANRSIFLEMLTTSILQKNNTIEIAGLLSKINEAMLTQDWRADAMITSMELSVPQKSSDPIRLTSAHAVFRNVADFPPAYQARLGALQSMFEWPGHTAVASSDTTDYLSDPDVQALFSNGRQYYLSGCAGCHGTDGAGLPRFAPPLVQSEWVLGDEQVLTRLVLHGLEGPVEVNGQTYDAPDILPVMPGHSVLDDREIASILTYIRLAWGHEAPPIQPRTASRIRHGSQGRVVPWTAEELLSLSFE